jgi:hypothetical protein
MPAIELHMCDQLSLTLLVVRHFEVIYGRYKQKYLALSEQYVRDIDAQNAK